MFPQTCLAPVCGFLPRSISLYGARGEPENRRNAVMSAQTAQRPIQKRVAGLDPTPAEDLAILRKVDLRKMSAIEAMYAYWGADRV